jgi:hypothetical protein
MAQCPDAPWNRKRKQAATRRSRVMRINVKQMNSEQEVLILNSSQEMDKGMPISKLKFYPQRLNTG